MNPKTPGLDPTPDANRDPITGAPGSHPIGTGVGALAGGVAAGAAIGTMAGPVGTAIGAAVGAIAGGLAGHGVAEMIDPTAEDAYWRANYEKQDYVDAGGSYDDYGPAYRYGVNSYRQYGDREFDDVERDLARDWTRNREASTLEWDRARLATRDSWQRVSDAVERAVPGDSDHDGK